MKSIRSSKSQATVDRVSYIYFCQNSKRHFQNKSRFYFHTVKAAEGWSWRWPTAPPLMLWFNPEMTLTYFHFSIVSFHLVQKKLDNHQPNKQASRFLSFHSPLVALSSGKLKACQAVSVLLLWSPSHQLGTAAAAESDDHDHRDGRDHQEDQKGGEVSKEEL